jgi:hypothetical protein
MTEPTYQVTTTTPLEDQQLEYLRAGLVTWLAQAEQKGIEHNLALTALMLFASSGVAASAIPREAFIDLMTRYYDIYRANFEALQKSQA